MYSQPHPKNRDLAWKLSWTRRPHERESKLSWGRAGRGLVRTGDGNELDVDLHVGLQMGEVGFDILKTNAAPKP